MNQTSLCSGYDSCFVFRRSYFECRLVNLLYLPPPTHTHTEYFRYIIQTTQVNAGIVSWNRKRFLIEPLVSYCNAPLSFDWFCSSVLPTPPPPRSIKATFIFFSSSETRDSYDNVKLCRQVMAVVLLEELNGCVNCM
jgi:hypothetical protein